MQPVQRNYRFTWIWDKVFEPKKLWRQISNHFGVAAWKIRDVWLIGRDLQRLNRFQFERFNRWQYRSSPCMFAIKHWCSANHLWFRSWIVHETEFSRKNAIFFSECFSKYLVALDIWCLEIWSYSLARLFRRKYALWIS